MNLSKSEKLLAAKKKLKEFQLSKLKQNDTTKIQNHTADSSATKCQDLEPDTTSSEISTKGSYEAANNLAPISDQAAIIPPEIDSAAVSQKQDLNDVNQVLTSKEEVDESSKPAKDLATETFSMMQKAQILEMTSAVTDVLMNDSECNEPTLNCDLVCRDQFLNSYLEEQKKIVNDLHLELSECRSTITELNNKLAIKESECQLQLAREIDPLKDQLQAYAQTTGILIAEKAELTAALAQTQQSARLSAEEVEEVSGKLRNSLVRISDLEKDISSLKTVNTELRKNSEQLQNNYKFLENEVSELRKEKEDLNLESSELKQKLNLKKTELVAVQQELQEKTALLSLSELRIQQMTDASQTEEEKYSMVLLEQELTKLRETLKIVGEEKEEASKQYQNYVKQLDAQKAKLLDEIKAQKQNIDELHSRENSYIQRLSNLEQELQQKNEKLENAEIVQNQNYQMDNLLKNVNELTLEQERLHITLAEKDNQIEELMREVSELRERNGENVEVSKLANALESEQLGASRAVHQNQQLKQQLTDMENAFVSLSNAKLDLTEQIQAERSIGRKLNAHLHKVETDVEELREALKEKEAAILQLEKEKLQNAQIADQIQHYQAQSHHADTYQRELQNALIYIENLEKEKKELLTKIQEEKQNGHVTEINAIPGDENHLPIERENELLQKTETDDAMMTENFKKLEQRFKETMEKVAELTEEKQKLEHLVLQLQGETETIGEYIALYQKQRAVLQNRAREKDQVFRELLEQRNLQQEQLHKLKVLVSEFLMKEHIRSNGTSQSITNEQDPNDVKVSQNKKEASNPMEVKGVSEILDLLTDIKDCKDSCIFEGNFHPCPWCSGKLITI